MSVSNTFFDRTLSNLRVAWRGIASLRKDNDKHAFSEALPESEHGELCARIRDCLEGKGIRLDQEMV